jgi:DNA-binding protein HU-beta
MNKVQLVKAIAAAAGLTQVASEKAITGFMDAVTDSLNNEKTVTLVGFGTFSIKNRAERVGRNPQTGESIIIKAKKVVKFKAGTKLAESVN